MAEIGVEEAEEVALESRTSRWVVEAEEVERMERIHELA